MNYFSAFVGPFAELMASLRDRRVAVVGHVRPDGDCIGSQVATCRVLRSQGIDAVCVNADAVPRRLTFLLGDTPFFSDREFLAAADSKCCSVYIDCADQRRAGGKLAKAFPRPNGNVDHHISNPGYAEQNIVDGKAAATAEVLAGIFFDAGFTVDAIVAQGLYAGIATDTGQFRFPSTSQRVFELTGRLIASGADPAAAAFQLYERETFEKMELLGRFLESFKRECDGRVCVGFLPASAFRDTGANSEDTEGLVDYARSIEGVDIGVLVEERPDGMKASLRAKDPIFRVDQIAAAFGGGGHACAAGLNQPASIDKVYPELIATISRHLAGIDGRPR